MPLAFSSMGAWSLLMIFWSVLRWDLSIRFSFYNISYIYSVSFRSHRIQNPKIYYNKTWLLCSFGFYAPWSSAWSLHFCFSANFAISLKTSRRFSSCALWVEVPRTLHCSSSKMGIFPESAEICSNNCTYVKTTSRFLNFSE